MNILTLIFVEALNDTYVLVFFWLFNKIFALKEKYRARRWFIYVGYYFFAYSVNLVRYYILGMNPLGSSVCSFVLLGSNLYLAIVLYEGSLGRKLFCFFVLKAYEALLSVIVVSVLMKGIQYYLSYLNNEEQFKRIVYQLLINGLDFLGCVIIVYFVKLLERRRRATSKASYNWQLIFALIPISLILLVGQVFYMFWERGGRVFYNGWLLITGSVLAVLGDILLFVALQQLDEKKELEKTMLLMEQQQNQYMTEMQAMETVSARQRMFDHDLKNQLVTVAALLEKGEISAVKESINELSALSKSFSEKQFCANSIVNTVLNFKMISAQAANIVFDIDALVPSNLSISAVDLCSVFSNVIDNAVNALSSFDGERILHLDCRVQHGFFVLNEHNAYCETAVKEENSDSSLHGNGLNILRFIADKYQGRFSYEMSEGRFSISLSFPLVAD